MKKHSYLFILSLIGFISCKKYSETPKQFINNSSAKYLPLPEDLILGKWNFTKSQDLWRYEYLNKITGAIMYDTFENTITNPISGSYLNFMNGNRVVRHFVEAKIHDTTEYKFIDFAWIRSSIVFPPSPSIGNISISIEPFSVRTLDDKELILFQKDGEPRGSGPIIDTFITVELIQYFQK